MFDSKYPYTDFHELNLDWFLEKFKEYYTQVDTQNQKIATLEETVEQFTTFVTNYFDNLDVQQEINNKLDAMAADGTLIELIQPYYDQIVAGQNQRIGTLETTAVSLQNQINEIVAPAGDPTLAEVAAARVNLDGVTYPTLKARCDSDARKVVYLKESFSECETQVTKINGIVAMPPFENGSVYANNGTLEYSNNSKRVRMVRNSYAIFNAGDFIYNPYGYQIGLNYSTDDGATYVYSGTANNLIPITITGRYAIFIQTPTDVTDVDYVVSRVTVKRPGSLKETIDYVDGYGNRLINIDGIVAMPPFEKGTVNASDGVLQYSNNSKRVRTIAGSYALFNAGDVIHNPLLYTVGLNYSTDDGVTYVYGSSYSTKLITLPVTGRYAIFIQTPADVTDVNAVANSITVMRAGSMKETVDRLELNTNEDVLKIGNKYIYHYGMDAVTDRSIIPVIPSQSVFDVRNAANLGYTYIEVNVHKTSDNKYVVTHGVSGNLGHDFDTLQGEDAYGTPIASNTLQYLQDNFRYRSSVADYRVPITTLEEFLQEAKLHNLVVMAQYVDRTELGIVRGIMGDHFFMYGAPRAYYAGPIITYHSYATKASIVAKCEEIGHPYIYSMANPTDFTDDDLQDIINTLHNDGYYIASAYLNSAGIKKYSAMGFDFFAVREGDVSNQLILNGKLITFNNDGTVTWTNAPLTN